MSIVERILENGLDAKTRMHYPDELALLQKLGRESIGPVINLGCYRGGSAAAFAYENKYDTYSVDVYDTYSVEYDEGKKPSAEAARELWKKLDLTVIQCVGTTDDWAVKLKDIRFGVVFIDADHSYEACKTDYETWLPLVMPGGVIVFHDNNARPVQAVLAQVELEQVARVRRTTVFRVE